MDCHNFWFQFALQMYIKLFELLVICMSGQIISELQNQNANLDRNPDFTMKRLGGKQEAF